jgi:RND family efflux transporter MFP subunit
VKNPEQNQDPIEAPAPTAFEHDPAIAVRRRRLVPAIIAGGVLAVLATGYVLFERAAARTNQVPLTAAPKGVTVVEARAATYRPSRRYVGTLEPWVEARIGPQLVSAYVSAVGVRPGATVKRGEVLATLDCREVKANSQAVAMQAKAIEARQAALAQQADRLGGLVDKGFVSANEVDLRKAESDSERERLLATKAQLAGASVMVDDCVLRAPFDGEIAARMIDPGAFVRPGTAIVSVVDRGVVRATADVPETDFDVVAPGTPVKIMVLSTGKPIEGKIARRSPAADPSTRTVRLEIDLPNPDLSIPVNTTAEISIEVGQPVPATEIPLTAANVRGRRANIFVVDGAAAHARAVQVVGERGGSLFVEPGLAAGAKVVTEGRALLADGDNVNARLETAAPPASVATPPPTIPATAVPQDKEHGT